MDIENGDQVTKPGCLCPKDSRGVFTPKIQRGVITPMILGGGVSNPNNPPYLRHWLALFL